MRQIVNGVGLLRFGTPHFVDFDLIRNLDGQIIQQLFDQGIGFARSNQYVQEFDSIDGRGATDKRRNLGCFDAIVASVNLLDRLFDVRQRGGIQFTPARLTDHGELAVWPVSKIQPLPATWCKQSSADENFRKPRLAPSRGPGSR